MRRREMDAETRAYLRELRALRRSRHGGSEVVQALQAACAAFNSCHPIGTRVRYWTGVREGDGRTSATRTKAQVLGGHTSVVWVDGQAGCIALSHVEPLGGAVAKAAP